MNKNKNNNVRLSRSKQVFSRRPINPNGEKHLVYQDDKHTAYIFIDSGKEQPTSRMPFKDFNKINYWNQSAETIENHQPFLNKFKQEALLPETSAQVKLLEKVIAQLQSIEKTLERIEDLLKAKPGKKNTWLDKVMGKK